MLSDANSLIRFATSVALFVEVPLFDLVMNLTAITSAPLRSRALHTSPEVPPAIAEVSVTVQRVDREFSCGWLIHVHGPTISPGATSSGGGGVSGTTSRSVLRLTMADCLGWEGRWLAYLLCAVYLCVSPLFVKAVKI